MDFATAGTDLEQQAAQLLLKLHVTSNPAFTDELEGTTDEELMIKADPFTAAARRSSHFPSSSSSNSFHLRNNNYSAFAGSNNSFDEFATAATSAAVAANADFLSAISAVSSKSRNRSSSKRRGRGGETSAFGGPENIDENDNNNDSVEDRQHHTAASFEIEAFRMVLKQQRAPSLRLLVAVSKSAVPALMCVLCNAQSFNTFDELCSGGRFESLYYDAKFKQARENDAQKQKERAERIEERRHCLFKPRTKENIAAELIARKRGEVYVDVQEESLAKKEAERLDKLNKSLRMPTGPSSKQQQQASDGSNGGEGNDKNVDDKKKTKKKKDGDGDENDDGDGDGDDGDGQVESEAPRDPDAFFKYNMEWKLARKRKLEKKLLKIKKEQEEEDEITFKQWQMSESSRAYAATRAEKRERGLVRQRTAADPCTFTPVTTPYRAKQPKVDMHVVERLQMDITRRKEDQMLREIEEIGKFRARTPRIEKTKLASVVKELYHPTPKRTTTFRKQIPVETPTFSPKISRGPLPLPVSSTTTTTAKGVGDAENDHQQKQQNQHASPASDMSRDRHSRRCITPYAVSKAQIRAMQVKPMTDEQANTRYRQNMDAMKEREERLQEIRDTIERKQAASCTFQNSDLVLTSKNDKMTSRYYDGIEDEMMNLSRLEKQKSKLQKINDTVGEQKTKQKSSTSRAVSPAASSSQSSPIRKNQNIITGIKNITTTSTIVTKEFSPPHITPSRRLEIPNKACPTDGLSQERRRRADGTESSTAFIRAGSFSPSPLRKRHQQQQQNRQQQSHHHEKAMGGGGGGGSAAAAPTKIETRIATNPADQQMMLHDLSDYFNKIVAKRNHSSDRSSASAGAGVLLPLSHAIELCHRIAVERKMIVSRILKWDDVQVIFPAFVSFVDFVKMFEIMAGSSLTNDFL